MDGWMWYISPYKILYDDLSISNVGDFRMISIYKTKGFLSLVEPKPGSTNKFGKLRFHCLGNSEKSP